MKPHTTLRNRLRALEALMSPKGVTVRITGGLPAEPLEAAPAAPPPPGGVYLKAQHAVTVRSTARKSPESPADASAVPDPAPRGTPRAPKTAVRGS